MSLVRNYVDVNFLALLELNYPIEHDLAPTLQPLRLLQQPRRKLPKDFDRLDKHGVGVVSGRNSE